MAWQMGPMQLDMSSNPSHLKTTLGPPMFVSSNAQNMFQPKTLVHKWPHNLKRSSFSLQGTY